MNSKSYIELEKNIYHEEVSTKEHFAHLYKLLESRKHFISHKKMPNYEEHMEFCKNNPYRLWFIVFQRDIVIGSFYITHDNCIGLNLKEDNLEIYKILIQYIVTNIEPLPPVPSLVPKNFYCNIPPSNKNLLEAAEALGGHITQFSVQF